MIISFDDTFVLNLFVCKDVEGKVYLRLYQTYILPIIEYCNLCYYTNNRNTQRIEKIQRRITKFISFKLNKPNLSYIDRLKHLKLVPLGCRKLIKQMILLKKIHDKHLGIPFYWINLITFKYSRHNDIEIVIPITRIQKIDHDLFIIMAKVFNTFQNDVRNSINSRQFIRNVKQLTGYDYS